MKDIKIFVTHTPNKESIRFQAPFTYDVIAGSSFDTKKSDDFYHDNTGENISIRNKSYCELTTQYWAWKNQTADYYGFCHYRRFFNFNESSLHESKWGTIEFDYFDAQIKEKLHLNESDMRNYIEKYDFLIAKGVEASSMNAKTLYSQYEKASDLHIGDVNILLNIINEKYPWLYETAIRFFKGKVFFPCNMFIMQKQLFQSYSEMLFDILEQFEQIADMSHYSREGYRTIGHLGERILSIYYLYLKEKNMYKLGELQVALFRNTDIEKEVYADKSSNAVPIVLAANKKYIPVLYTCIQSIVENINEENHYHIYIFHTDILGENQKVFDRLSTRPNVNFTFINVGKKVSGFTLKAKEHISTETFYRFLILDILKGYSKAVYLDCDMIICRDIAELYHTELGSNLVGAVLDADFAGQCNIKTSDMKNYCNEVLGLANPFLYFQAGVLVLNIEELSKITSVEELFKMSDTGIYRFSDQDILNIICQDRVTYLDMRWNVLSDCNHSRWHQVIQHAPHYILDAYENSRKNPFIIHYAGFLKPWMAPEEDYADLFWNAARTTPFYETLLGEMMDYKYTCHDILEKQKQRESRSILELMRKIFRRFFPRNSKLRDWGISIYFKLKNLNGD